MSSVAEHQLEPAEARSPLVVGLDRALLRVDTVFDLFAAALFRRPLPTLLALTTLLAHGPAAFRRRLAELHALDAEGLPVREEVLAWLADEKARGRPVHLACDGETATAERLAEHMGLFDGVHETGALAAAFPAGFAYAGARGADMAVWRQATSAVVVASPALERRVAAVAPVERGFRPGEGRLRDWLKAARPHQWSKNVLVLAPVALGLHLVTQAGLLRAVAAMLLLCVIASLTYLVNDAADLEADRRHWSKRRRPLASGALPVGPALLAAGIGIPVVLAAGFWLSMAVGLCLSLYVVTTLAYSFALKRIPLVDGVVIGGLFTLRLAVGIAAAGLEWSAWLLTFSTFFFFSLAIAKRHTEILRVAEAGEGPVRGRGYRVEDAALTLAFGVSAAMASILIVVLYLVEEVFPRSAYADPAWLWAAPPLMFVWVARVWFLAHRGRMNDDPVVFALKDPVSLGLGAALGAAFLLALT
ncbi:UbiA family prenyltransferase [Phenylobacterium terrae]|uniref:UbiA family prenyltransferase n=1 Tax=Phenylobacterium terrae TaxID=2665495 RepID=A0ABW4N3B7_9CAUL